MDTFSLTDIKKKNMFDIFHYIYRNKGCSKQAIASSLSISLPTVTQHLITLQKKGLIEKCGQLSSSVGRRATAYSIIPTARISIGIEILDHNVYITALNLYGKKETKEKFRLDFRPNKEYFEQLTQLVYAFMKNNGFEEEQLLGIGLGIQGLTNPNGDAITYGKILGCTGLSIDLFSSHFSVPCRFIHDAECAAGSELWENPDITDAICLSLGYHLGGAVIINNQLQTGVTGKSGTFEHMTLVPGGLTCYCGKIGCAECYCSGSSLLADSEMELEEFFDKKAQGDPNCQARWNSYLSYLSVLINNLHLVIESTVILAGHITPYFSEEDLAYIKNEVVKLSTFEDPAEYIIPGRCRNDAVSIGAALPFIREFLEKVGLDDSDA